MALREYLVEEVAQDCADGLLTRREALRRLGLLGLSAAAGGALLAACGDSGRTGTQAPTTAAGDATAAQTPTPGGGQATGPSAAAETIRFQGPSGELVAGWAAPAAAPQGAVLVIHENRGLTPHFYDVAGRLAADGYSALCVDLLSAQGGTASLTDPAAAPTALANAPEEQLLGDLRAGIDELQRRAPDAAIGTVGFCFGGGMVWRLLDAGEARLAAAVPFYGPVPEDPDFSGAQAAVLAIYAGQDDRVNATRERAEAALQAAGLTYEIRTFEGADHAFFNDTGERYHPEAARQAYTALLDWFGRHLS
jgi:carboxymethylenebutenolidase